MTDLAQPSGAGRRRRGGLFPRLAVALVLFAQERSVARGLVAARACVPGTKVDLQFLQGASAGKQAVKLEGGVLRGVHKDEGATLSGSLDLPGDGPWQITFQFTQLAPAGSAAHKSDWVSAFLLNKPVAKVKYQAQPKAARTAQGSVLKTVELTAFDDLVSYLFVFHGDGVGVTLGKAVCSKSYDCTLSTLSVLGANASCCSCADKRRVDAIKRGDFHAPKQAAENGITQEHERARYFRPFAVIIHYSSLTYAPFMQARDPE